MSTGSDRIKKRSNKQSTRKQQSAKVSVSVPGTFVQLDVYKEDIAADPASKGHSIHKIEDPSTSEKIDAVFIPKLKRGYFEGCVSGSKKIKMEEELDNNGTALRDNQVQESFHDEMGRFNKSDMPEIKADAETWDQATHKEVKPAPEMEEAGPASCFGQSDSDSFRLVTSLVFVSLRCNEG